MNLDKLFSTMNIKSVLDIPHGDFRWMQKVDFSNIEYIGGDIVEELILENSQAHQDKENIKFKVVNLIDAPLPKSDILII